MNPQVLINKLNLAYPKAIDLLSPRWKEENLKDNVPSVGFCYLGAEVAFHYLGGKKLGWKPYCAVYFEDNQKCTHWWISREGNIVDPTSTQYTAFGLQPPYNLGKGNGFLTKNPSKKAKILMQIAGL